MQQRMEKLESDHVLPILGNMAGGGISKNTPRSCHVAIPTDKLSKSLSIPSFARQNKFHAINLHTLYIISTLVFISLSATARTSTPATRDSSELKATLLIVDHGKELYSSLGHCALRLQAPQFGLDYCFTYEANAEENITDYLRLFAAQTKAHWVAVKSQQYFADYAKEHRGITEYVLPLKRTEIQRLWKNLDDAITSGADDQFDFLTNNCTQGLLRMLDLSIDGELPMKEPKETVDLDNGQLARLETASSPWMQFLIITLMGSQADGHWEPMQRATPELLPKMLGLAHPLQRIGQQDRTVKDRITEGKATPFTPNMVFGSLLIVAALLTAFEWQRNRSNSSTQNSSPSSYRRSTAIGSWAECIAQLTLFIFLFWLTQVSGLFTVGDGSFLKRWNWYLIPMFPFPLLFLLYKQFSKDKARATQKDATGIHCLHYITRSFCCSDSAVITTRHNSPTDNGDNSRPQSIICNKITNYKLYDKIQTQTENAGVSRSHHADEHKSFQL